MTTNYTFKDTPTQNWNTDGFNCNNTLSNGEVNEINRKSDETLRKKNPSLEKAFQHYMSIKKLSK